MAYLAKLALTLKCPHYRPSNVCEIAEFARTIEAIALIEQ
jgi:hypothetical protein